MLDWKVVHPRKRKDPVCYAEVMNVVRVRIYCKRLPFFSERRRSWDQAHYYQIEIKFPHRKGEPLYDSAYSIERAQEQAISLVENRLNQEWKQLASDIRQLEQHRTWIKEYLEKNDSFRADKLVG